MSKPRLKKFERAEVADPLKLQPRDIALLRDVAEFRFLNTAQIFALHPGGQRNLFVGWPLSISTAILTVPKAKLPPACHRRTWFMPSDAKARPPSLKRGGARRDLSPRAGDGTNASPYLSLFDDFSIQSLSYSRRDTSRSKNYSLGARRRIKKNVAANPRRKSLVSSRRIFYASAR